MPHATFQLREAFVQFSDDNNQLSWILGGKRGNRVDICYQLGAPSTFRLLNNK